jgi:hypothetical protein
MPSVYNGLVGVQHYNWYLEGDVSPPAFHPHDGLVVSEQADHLWLNTGTAFGVVPVVINLLDGPPASADGWERVQDATMVVTQSSMKIIGGDSEWYGNINLTPGTYNVRYCINGYEVGMRQDIADEDHPALDSYQLDIWPA